MVIMADQAVLVNVEADSVLKTTAFATAWAQGRAMTMEQAVAYTLAEVRDRPQLDTSFMIEKANHAICGIFSNY